MSTKTRSGKRGKLWTKQEDQLVLDRYRDSGGTLRLPGRTACSVHQRASRLGVTNKQWSLEEDAILKAHYVSEGWRKVAKRTGRSPTAVKSRAIMLGLKCLVRSDGDRIWTDPELVQVRKRYPTEGATQLAIDLKRTSSSVSACAHILGVWVDRSRYQIFSKGRFGEEAKTFRGHGKVFGFYVGRLRQRSRRSGLPCTVDAQYLDSITVDTCPLSGFPLTYHKHSTDRSATASLDRIDSTKGYVPGNVQWVHKDINKVKMDMTERRLFEFCRAIATTLAKRYT